MKTLVLNSTHYVAGSGNQFIYPFPTAIGFGKGDKIGLANLSISNSTYNVSAARGNNKITVYFYTISNTVVQLPKGNMIAQVNNTPVAYNFYFPDGYYTVSQLNTYLQLQMFNQGLYLTANSGATVIYFFNIVTIASQYAVQINCFSIPDAYSAGQLGYLAPTGTIPTGPITGLSGALAGTTYVNAGGNKNTWCVGGLAAVFVQITPTLSLPRSFGSLLGFTTISSFNAIQIVNGAYSPLPTIFTSNVTPIISPVNSYIMTCSLINVSRIQLHDNV